MGRGRWGQLFGSRGDKETQAKGYQRKAGQGILVCLHALPYKRSCDGEIEDYHRKLLGKIITRLGFCPEDDGAIGPAITCFNYCEYLLASKHSKDDFNLLKKMYHTDVAELLGLSIDTTIMCLDLFSCV